MHSLSMRRSRWLHVWVSFQLLCSVWVVWGGNPPASIASWLGTYQGSCAIKTQLDSNNFVQCIKDGDVEAAFVNRLAWDAKSNKLLVDNNVTWVTNSSTGFTNLPPTATRKTATILPQNITFNQPGIKPLCISTDNTFPPSSYGIAVYQEFDRRVYIEEGVFLASNMAEGIPEPAWYCPASMSTVQSQLNCNKTSYNYRCKGTLLPPPSPPPPPPHPPPPPPPPFPPPPRPVSPIIPVTVTRSPAPSPEASPSPSPSPSPITSSSASSADTASTQLSASDSSSNSSKKTVTTVAAVCGAVGAVLLGAAIAGLVIHKRGYWCCKTEKFPSYPVAADVILFKGDPLPGPIQGLVTGDPFVRGTAPQYSWTLDTADDLPCIQAGITDTYLDSMATEGEPGPCVQLTSAQVRQEIELLTSGLLGRGGAALVFRCRWRKRFGNALLAIKLLKDAFDTPISVLQSFEYEARLLSAIRHPNVVQLYGWCMELPNVCLIMELLPGSLEDLLYGTPAGGLSKAPATSTQASGSTTTGYKPPSYVTRGGTANTNSGNHTSTAAANGATNDTGFTGSSATVSAVKAKALGTASDNAPDTVLGNAADTVTGSAAGTVTSSAAVTATGSNTVTDSSRQDGCAVISASPSTPSIAGLASILSQAGDSGQTQQKLSMQAVLQVTSHVATALAYLHDRQVTGIPEWQVAAVDEEGVPEQAGAETRVAKVVHRDLKPANVLINSNGQAKLSDFGLAREHNSTTIYTTHVNAGTLAYMAPELLAMGPTKPTNKVDIYSLGIMMWEMVENRKPWKEASQQQLVSAVLRDRRPPIPSWSLLQAASSGNSSSPSVRTPHQDSSSSLSKATAAPVDYSQVPADFSACPEYLDLLKECWAQREYKRPSAADVLKRVQRIISSGQAGAV